MASVIAVPLPQKAYSIALVPDGLAQIGDWLTKPLPDQGQGDGLPLSETLGKKILVVSNPQIFKAYGDAVTTSLVQAGFSVSTCILPPGERYKTPATLQKIYDAALAQRLERSSTLLALGGGVIGDMTGFAAATWLRGINVIQVPTSLLAMVDASIGGKTGVNHPQGKNLIGAFHQPRLVFIDSQVLKTLPAREFRAGMAEVIKYGIIWSPELFAQLEACPRLDQIRYVSPELQQAILQHSCQAKATVVSQDEREAGLRAILNYGHTIGHAVESLTGYRLVNHGEAVAIGMVAAGRIALEMGLWTQADCDRQDQLIAKTGLPTRIPAGVAVEAIVEALQLDKKVKAGQVRFILPTRIGRVEVRDDVPAATLRDAIRGSMGAG